MDHKPGEENIYDDIYDFDLGAEIEKLKKENKNLEAHTHKLQLDIEKLCKCLQEIKRSKEVLAVHISSLYLTAKAEIDRKDRMIADLRRELDNFMFRRNVPNRNVNKNCQDNAERANNGNKKRKFEDDDCDVENKKSKFPQASETTKMTYRGGRSNERNRNRHHERNHRDERDPSRNSNSSQRNRDENMDHIPNRDIGIKGESPNRDGKWENSYKREHFLERETKREHSYKNGSRGYSPKRKCDLREKLLFKGNLQIHPDSNMGMTSHEKIINKPFQKLEEETMKTLEIGFKSPKIDTENKISPEILDQKNNIEEGEIIEEEIKEKPLEEHRNFFKIENNFENNIPSIKTAENHPGQRRGSFDIKTYKIPKSTKNSKPYIDTNDKRHHTVKTAQQNREQIQRTDKTVNKERFRTKSTSKDTEVEIKINVDRKHIENDLEKKKVEEYISATNVANPVVRIPIIGKQTEENIKPVVTKSLNKEENEIKPKKSKYNKSENKKMAADHTKEDNNTFSSKMTEKLSRKGEDKLDLEFKSKICKVEEKKEVPYQDGKNTKNNPEKPNIEAMRVSINLSTQDKDSLRLSAQNKNERDIKRKHKNHKEKHLQIDELEENKLVTAEINLNKNEISKQKEEITAKSMEKETCKQTSDIMKTLFGEDSISLDIANLDKQKDIKEKDKTIDNVLRKTKNKARGLSKIVTKPTKKAKSLGGTKLKTQNEEGNQTVSNNTEPVTVTQHLTEDEANAGIIKPKEQKLCIEEKNVTANIANSPIKPEPIEPKEEKLCIKENNVTANIENNPNKQEPIKPKEILCIKEKNVTANIENNPIKPEPIKAKEEKLCIKENNVTANLENNPIKAEPIKQTPPTSFKNILEKTVVPQVKPPTVCLPQLHLTHDGDIPVLHLEETSFNNQTNEGLPDKNIYSLIDVMNITTSNLEADLLKFKNSNNALTNNVFSGDNKNMTLTFSDYLNKETSANVMQSLDINQMDDTKSKVRTEQVSVDVNETSCRTPDLEAKSNNTSQTNNSLNKSTYSSRRRRRKIGVMTVVE